MHVDKGSTINLTCVSKFSPKPPPDVIWYHNDKVSWWRLGKRPNEKSPNMTDCLSVL